MKELLDKIIEKSQANNSFCSAKSDLKISEELKETVLEFLLKFGDKYSNPIIKNAKTKDGVFLVEFSINDESFVCKVFFEDVQAAKDTEFNVLTTTNGKIKTNTYPTEEMVESNEDTIIVYKENAVGINVFPASSLDVLMPSVIRSLSLLHKAKCPNLRGSFADLFQDMSASNNSVTISIDYNIIAEKSFKSIYKKLKGEEKGLCLGSYDLNNFRIQDIEGYTNTAVKFFNCWYCVKDYKAIDYALLVEFMVDMGASRQNMHKSISLECGTQMVKNIESIRSEVSDLTALAYFLFASSETRDRPKFMSLFVDRVRLSRDPAKFKKMVEKMAD